MKLHAISDATFAPEVLETAGLVLVDFWAPWCAPCKVQHPILETLAGELPKVKFASVNVDENPTTAGRYQILSIPTILIFRGGQALAQLIGLQSHASLRAKIADLQASAVA